MKLIATLLLALALTQQRPQGQRPQPEPPPKPVALIHCKPGSIQLGRDAARPSDNPIAEALTRSGPGTLIELEGGDYPAFTMGFGKGQRGEAMTHGGSPGNPVIVRAVGGGRPRIRPNGGGDTIAVAQAMRVGNITFQGILIVCGYRAGVIFYKLDDPTKVHEGFHFIDCEINGAYDHLAQQGVQSKWGIWGHSLKDFVFKGVDKPAVVRDICHEHAFYLQNARGDITIENVLAQRIGRTFCQFTARPSDGTPGTGTITIRHCIVEDACIAAGDNYKGGAAFTFAGRHDGTVLVEGNRYRAGFAPGIQKLTGPESPYGTGAFVAWDYHSGATGKLILRDNDFELAKGCGDRPVVSIGGCRDVQVVGKNRFVSGGVQPALDLDPTDEKGLTNTAITTLSLDPATEIAGRIKVRGKVVAREEVASAYAPKPAEAKNN
jgi:hypothetical protein